MVSCRGCALLHLLHLLLEPWRAAAHRELLCFVQPQIHHATMCAWLFDHNNICVRIITKQSATDVLQTQTTHIPQRGITAAYDQLLSGPQASPMLAVAPWIV